MYWSLHTHTRESAVDALPSVQRVVDRAVELGYPALGITDHGTISGAVEFYLACRKAGIEPLIGVEVYLAFDRSNSKKTMHSLIVAYSEQGYRNLCRLVTLSGENFYRKPVIDLGDLASFANEGMLDGLLMTSGCWFGLIPKLLRENDFTSVANVVKALNKWFNGMFFIEVQNHGIQDADHDDDANSLLLYKLAEQWGARMVITQDSHYLYREDQALHDAFKTLVSWSDDPDNAVFPGDGYHMVDLTWMEEHHIPEIFEAGMNGLDYIRSKACLRIPELEEFHLRVPDTTVSGDADKELTGLACSRLDEFVAAKRIAKSKHHQYLQRIDEELDVIISSGFAGYLMLVKTVCDFMRENGIIYRVRGSATGSLVCWLLGITGYDPLRWSLSFDRFLSRDRTKPPDIDLDVEHTRRQEVLDWLSTKFYVCHIGTSMSFGLDEGEEDEEKGSLIVAFRMRQDKIGADRDAPIPKQWMIRMKRIAEYNGTMPDGTAIDPPLKSVGKHPAGILIAPDHETLQSVPKRYVSSSKTMVTSYDMGDVEKLGLVKLDVLGLRTLTAVNIACRLAGVDIDSISLTDGPTYSMISSGRTAGMFQLEGWTAAKGVRRMRPKKISDVIAAMAVFRPAAIKSGATESYLLRRQGAEPIPQRHDLIMKHTADTYGVLIYQEQALNILKDLGLSVEEIEKARKAIKASNANVGNAAKSLEELMEHIKSLAKDVGMNKPDVDWLSTALHAYAGYSFNRAHATAYGILAYQTAYLAAHHKVQFWTGTLIAAVGGAKKYGEKPEDLYKKAAKNAGIVIRKPHVNLSDISYSTDGSYIYEGIQSIKDVGEVAAREIVDNAPYESLDDLARRVSSKVSGSGDLLIGHSPAACPGVIRALHDAGALEGIGWEVATGPMNKVDRNRMISVANKMILDITQARVSRKSLGQIVDQLDVDKTFWEMPKPDRAMLVAQTYLRSANEHRA